MKPGKNTKDYTQHLEHGGSLKSRICDAVWPMMNFVFYFCKLKKKKLHEMAV
jgi:hypothetical protein